MRRVIRDDGREFASIADAVRETLQEFGIMRPDAHAVASNIPAISSTCRGKRKTAMGHAWRYADEPTHEEVCGIIRELWGIAVERCDSCELAGVRAKLGWLL